MVAVSVLSRRSMGERGVRRCVRSHDSAARWYARTKMPQSWLFACIGRSMMWMVTCGVLFEVSWNEWTAREERVQSG
jgi:hypothetical protein